MVWRIESTCLTRKTWQEELKVKSLSRKPMKIEIRTLPYVPPSQCFSITPLWILLANLSLFTLCHTLLRTTAVTEKPHRVNLPRVLDRDSHRSDSFVTCNYSINATTSPWAEFIEMYKNINYLNYNNISRLLQFYLCFTNIQCIQVFLLIFHSLPLFLRHLRFVAVAKVYIYRIVPIGTVISCFSGTPSRPDLTGLVSHSQFSHRATRTE